MDFQYSYDIIDRLTSSFGASWLVGDVVSGLLNLASFILFSIGLYTIAKRRGICNPWMAWIPVINYWIVGSISDQYRYVTRGQIRYRRIVLLVMGIIIAVVWTVLKSMIRTTLLNDMALMMNGMEDAVWMEMAMELLGYLAAVLVMLVFVIIRLVFYCMAMYDLYLSVNPPHCVTFLVLSIIFPFTEGFFVFFNRKKDLGMPPRIDTPVYAPPQAYGPEL